MVALPFDFASYLLERFGTHHWDIEELMGGAANYTVRATRRVDQDSKQPLSAEPDGFIAAQDVPSVVLKQAPEFLAKAPQISFSSHRQTIEAEALKLFHPSTPCIGALQGVLHHNPLVHVPKLVHLDTGYHVLVQSDLGQLPNLYDVLTTPDIPLSLATHIGTTVGKFLADMHNSSISMSDFSSLVKICHNEDAEHVMETVIRNATKLMEESGISDFDVLGQRALDHWRTRPRTVFAQGDIWFGTLLVDVRHALCPDVNSSSLAAVGICDWEFAGPNDPAADIAQLGCYLHLLSISPLTTPSGGRVVAAFAEGLYTKYFSSLAIPVGLPFIASLLTLHGWEMINAAGWDTRQDMWCKCEGRNVRCDHIKTMIHEGAKFLRASGKSSFPEDSDWQVLGEVPWTRYFSPLFSSAIGT